MSVNRVTENGEITYDTETKLFTVWNESYGDPVCVTQYDFIAFAALNSYADRLI